MRLHPVGHYMSLKNSSCNRRTQQERLLKASRGWEKAGPGRAEASSRTRRRIRAKDTRDKVSTAARLCTGAAAQKCTTGIGGSLSP